MSATRTQLILATAGGRLDDVELHLAVADASDINSPTTSGATPLYVAAHQGHVSILESLLRHRAHVDYAMEDGSTPVFIAAWHGHRGAVRALLCSGADANRSSDTGATPLFAAAMLGHAGVAEELLHHGVQVDQASHEGVTPLMAAAAADHADVVESLLRQKADVCRLRGDGETALSVSARMGHKRVSPLLRSAFIARSLPRVVAAASARNWRPLEDAFDWPAVEAAERTVFVELARAVCRSRGSVSGETANSSSSESTTVMPMSGPAVENLASGAVEAKFEGRREDREERGQLVRPKECAGTAEVNIGPAGLSVIVAPYLNYADELSTIAPTVAYYCRVFTTALLINAMKRGRWSAGAEQTLVSALETAERSKPDLDARLGQQQLDAFVLRSFRDCLQTDETNSTNAESVDEVLAVNFRKLLLLLDVLEWCQGGRLSDDWVILEKHARKRSAELARGTLGSGRCL